MNRRHFVLALSSAPLLAQTAPPTPELEWVEAKKLTVEGFGFKDVKLPYDRLPGRAEGVVRPAVWNLSRDSAGALVRFTAATTEIHARWTVTNKNLAGANITAIASSGLDLYAKTDAGKWRWLAVGQPKFAETTAALVTGIAATEREFMVYLPLRNGVTSLEFGVPKGATLKPGPVRAAGSKPIVFYGTSITHGIGASRAGMTHVAMLGRTFDREAINLGFSGNGRMEPEVVKFVAELDPAVFVLDCLPNMGAQQVTERTAPGVKLLREAHPNTPILLVEDRNIQSGFLVEARRKANEANHAALREAFAALEAEKVPRVYYLEGANLLGDDGEGTVDGSHPTDLGFMRQAAEFERVLRPVLK
ncbi:MAG TPA: SGNH/GDSL hydrolase family protein [Bryobacteraceae bacterium]|nr:SGNH/GDSL hydrolase family protein [Bryobacteraceae bacterium]